MAWWIRELTAGPTLSADLVDDFFELAADSPLREVIGPDSAKQAARLVLAAISSAPAGPHLAVETAARIHAMPQARSITPGDIVERADVEALGLNLLRARNLQERILERVAESPSAATVASKFVTRIVSDVLNSNRAWAEKVPGVSSIFSMGTTAAKRMRSVAERPVEALLGDATDKGAAYAIRWINAALLELVTDAPVHRATMEIWDLQAELPVADLHSWLRAKEIRDITKIGHRLWASGATSPYADAVIDAVVDVVYEQLGDYSIPDALAECGIERDHLVEIVETLSAHGLERAFGVEALETLLRRRLEPFYASPAVATILARGPVAPKK